MVNETSMRIHDFCMKNTHCNTYAKYIYRYPLCFRGGSMVGSFGKWKTCVEAGVYCYIPPLPKSQLVQDRVQANHRIRFSKVRPHFLPQLSFLLGQCVKYERQLCIMNGTPHANLVTRRRSQFTDDIGVITFDVLLKTSVI